jgi:hypothetical protein
VTDGDAEEPVDPRAVVRIPPREDGVGEAQKLRQELLFRGTS